MSRKYSPKEREVALAVCAQVGGYRASKQLGIPQSTLSLWMRKAGISCSSIEEKMLAAAEARNVRVAAKRALLREVLMEKALDLAARMDEPHIDFKAGGPTGPFRVTFPKAPAAACQNYAVSIGVLIDKFRLESGEVTSRDEHRNLLAKSELDQTIEAELAELADRKARGVALGGPTKTV